MFEQEDIVSGIKKYIDDEVVEVYREINYLLSQIEDKLYEDRVAEYASSMLYWHEKLKVLRELQEKIKELETQRRG